MYCTEIKEQLEQKLIDTIILFGVEVILILLILKNIDKCLRPMFVSCKQPLILLTKV